MEAQLVLRLRAQALKAVPEEGAQTPMVLGDLEDAEEQKEGQE